VRGSVELGCERVVMTDGMGWDPRSGVLELRSPRGTRSPGGILRRFPNFPRDWKITRQRERESISLVPLPTTLNQFTPVAGWPFNPIRLLRTATTCEQATPWPFTFTGIQRLNLRTKFLAQVFQAAD
jgi:hypothetical protein